VIVHSARLLEQVRPLLRRIPIGVVPHGTSMAMRPAPVPRQRRLLLFGRLFAYKGVDTALEAFRMLPSEMSDVEIIIAGRGPLANLARGERNVAILNEYITEPDVERLLGDARLVLLPYKDATQSGVGLQAVARGVPCIVSSAGGLPELVQSASATLVVPPNDPGRLAEAIVAHIDHGEDLRQAIYDHAGVHFSWIVVARELRAEMRRLAF
jgi:glycosyltransferase involved in cell wall biosynthesis